MIESKGAAVYLSKDNLDARTIVSALQAVLEPNGCVQSPLTFFREYRVKAQRLSRLFQSRPLSPEEIILRYQIEFSALFRSVDLVAEFGPLTEYRVKGAELLFFVRESLDIYAFLLGLLLLVAWLVSVLMRRLVSLSVR